jgi:hypothetical protein
MTAKKKRAGVEWVGGLATLPGYVSGEGKPYRPETLFWVGESGAVLGSEMAKPGELVGMAAESLQKAIEHPAVGHPHAPTRVRVTSPELAEALRAAHPSIEIVCAPTPEADAVAASMRAYFARNVEFGPSYLSHEVDAAAVASFFRAAAGLFRAKPWRVVPDDQSLFLVTIEQLDVRGAALCVVGQMGQSMGLVLFSGLNDFEAYGDAVEAIERGKTAAVPPHFALNFGRRADLPASLRAEIAEHGWEVADEGACPWLAPTDEGLEVRPPTAEEVTIAEALALALPPVLSEKKALLAAWEGGEPFARTLRVTTHAGEIEVALRAPYEPAERDARPAREVLAELAELGPDGDEIDARARGRLEDELLRAFAVSPEANALDGVQWSDLVFDYATTYFGATVATLGPAELREILFDLFPRKVSVLAAKAPTIVDECRALYAFLKREGGLKQADVCLRVLGDDAAERLEAALSNPRNFGMAKSLVMAGHTAGFDMGTQEGVEAWMRAVQAGPLPASVRLPPLGGPSWALDGPSPTLTPAERAKKKSQRKAARKARKKNR